MTESTLDPQPNDHPRTAQSVSPFLRVKTPEPMSAREIDQRARACWEAIAGETGTRRTHAMKVARLYNVCRDLQVAREEGAGAKVLLAAGGLVLSVIAASLGFTVAHIASVIGNAFTTRLTLPRLGVAR